MPARPLPNLQLQAFFDLGEDGWNDEYDLNMLRLSVLTQAGAAGKFAAEPANPPAGMVVLLDETNANNPNAVAVFDAGVWKYVTPLEGWLIYDRTNDVYLTFNGVTWIALETGGGYDGPVLPALAGQAGRLLAVNDAEDGVEWVDPPEGGGGTTPANPNVPADADWTWVTQGTARRQYSATKGLAVIAPVGTSQRIVKRDLPNAGAGNYRAVMRLNVSPTWRSDDNNRWFLAGWRDSATGKFHTIDRRMNNGGYTIIEGWSNPDSWGGVQGYESNPRFSTENIYVGLRRQGSTIYFELSHDGFFWVPIFYRDVTGSYLGASGYNQVVFGVYNNSASGIVGFTEFGVTLREFWIENL